VLYRHYACCEVARTQSSLPKIETRRACDRCKKFKSRCSGGVPCERCKAAAQVCTISRPSLGIQQERKRSPTTSSTVSLSQPAPAISDPAFESLDWNFFYSTLQDMAVPDILNVEAPTNFNFDPWGVGFPGLVEGFSPPDETQLDWNIDGLSYAQLDPFEAHRLKITDYLMKSGQVTSCQLVYLSAKSAKVCFHSYFNRFQAHSPFLHLPTFSISKISTSMFFAMLLLGALHCGEPDQIDVMRVIWPLAESFVWSESVDNQPGSPQALDTINALFTLSIFHIYCMREPGEHPSYDFAKLVNTAKAWKIFDGDRSGDMSTDWHTWIAAESKKR